MKNSYSDIYETLNVLREAEKKNTPSNDDAVPYSAQDTLMTNTLASAKQEFGADFNEINRLEIVDKTDVSKVYDAYKESLKWYRDLFF